MIYEPEEIKTWLDGLKEFDEYNKNVLLSTLSVLGIPHSLLDVGCGDGAIVNTARMLGVDAHGMDLLPLEGQWFHCHDLTTPIDLGVRFNVVISIEVAEHIDPEGADIYSDTLAKHTEVGCPLILTAAPPGQLGHRHVNCQPPEYWLEKMRARNFEIDPVLTKRIQNSWRMAHHCMRWIEDNLQVFIRRA